MIRCWHFRSTCVHPVVFLGGVDAAQYFGFCVVFYRLLFELFFLWPLYCLSFDLRLLITPLVSFGHCIACPSTYGFWLPLWYLVAIVLPVLRLTASDYPFGILWPLYCMSFDLRLLITPLVSSGHCIAYPSTYGFWLPLLASFGHCIACPSTYGFWLPLWYLVAIVLPVLRLTASDYPFGILWPLCCLSFYLRLLITSLVSFGRCVACPSTYGFRLPLWYMLAIVLPVLRLTASDYPFGIFKRLLKLAFIDISNMYH